MSFSKKFFTNSKKCVLNWPVFLISTGLLAALVFFTALFPKKTQVYLQQIQTWVVNHASWLYVLAVATILLFCVFVMLSRYGDIKLGPDHSEPDYRNVTWFAMLFSTGMGIGLMFFGVAEPLMHYANPPVELSSDADAAREAMKLTFFHWGLHAWSIYAAVGLILAYFCYRHNLPLTLRSALYPLIGERIYGPLGYAVDIFAIVGTILGVATSLGYGVLQVNSGLNYLFGVPVNETMQVILIIGISMLAILSVASGLNKGIRFLSELNLALAVLLMLFIFIFGPTVFLLQTFVQNTGSYLSEIVNKTFNLYAYEPPTDWLGGWTIFYWGWWISWSPFVGMFIARISRGRTIREFISGVLFVPAGFTLLWMTVFGDTAIYMVLYENVKELLDVVERDNTLALFVFLEHFPLTMLVSVLAIIMVAVFFVTSADSGALVVDMIASGGAMNTPMWQRIFWGSSITVVAVCLLLVGGLRALQTVTIISALPFVVVLLFTMWGLLKALRLDMTKQKMRFQQFNGISTPQVNMSWQRRLRNIATFPRRVHVQRFIEEVVSPACEDVAAELRKQSISCYLSNTEKDKIVLEVDHGGEANFIYSVLSRVYALPSFMMHDIESEEKEERKYFRAEVHLAEGGQNYDIMGWSRDDVINDILVQYEKHLHYLHMIR